MILCAYGMDRLDFLNKAEIDIYIDWGDNLCLRGLQFPKFVAQLLGK